MCMERSSGAKGVGWLMPALSRASPRSRSPSFSGPSRALVRRHYQQAPALSRGARQRPTAGCASARWLRSSRSAAGSGRSSRCSASSSSCRRSWTGWCSRCTSSARSRCSRASRSRSGTCRSCGRRPKRWLGKIWAVVLVLCDGGLRLGRGRLPPGRHQHELLMQLSVARELIPLSAPFTITGYTFTDMSAVVARVERARRGRRRRGRRRLLPRRRRRPHVRRDRGRAPRRRGGHRPRVAAPPAAAGRRAQCPRLRALGPRSEAAPPAGLAHRGTRASAPAAHHVHHSRRTTRLRWPRRRSSTPRRNRSS